MENHATRIAELRKKANLTQSELGEKLNVTPQAVSKWENGLSEPDVETFKKMSRLFDVSIDYIVTGKKETVAPVKKNVEIKKTEGESSAESEKQVQPVVVTKIISGYCKRCKKPVGPNEYEVESYGEGLQQIYCKRHRS